MPQRVCATASTTSGRPSAGPHPCFAPACAQRRGACLVWLIEDLARSVHTMLNNAHEPPVEREVEIGIVAHQPRSALTAQSPCLALARRHQPRPPAALPIRLSRINWTHVSARASSTTSCRASTLRGTMRTSPGLKARYRSASSPSSRAATCSATVLGGSSVGSWEPSSDGSLNPIRPRRAPRPSRPANRCGCLQGLLEVSDGTRTRGRRDHNPANPVVWRIDLAL